LASGLQEAWSANKDTLTSGRVEINLFRFAADTDVLYLSKMIARSQLKKFRWSRSLLKMWLEISGLGFSG
jgi:hypothetical protein